MSHVEIVDLEARAARITVPDYQLSLAIGREGQNARLAARLTGWRIDIKSETEFAAEEQESGYEEEETQGRCAAILGNGRRCPNAALPSSRYCGLDSHQALADQPTDYVTGAPPEQPDLEARAARITVPDYQLSLAIGKEGQNARLAARLTGWRIDIRPDVETAQPRSEPVGEAEPVDEPVAEPDAEARA